MKKLLILLLLLPLIGFSQVQPDSVITRTSKAIKINYIAGNDSDHVWILNGPIITDSAGQIIAFPDVAGGHNKILRYDTACKCLIWTLDSGVTVTGDSLIYGTYGYSDSIITIPLDSGVWTDVSNDSVIFTEIESRGIDHIEGDTFGLYYDGVYQIIPSHTLRMDSGAGVIVFRLLINGDSAGVEWGEYVGTSSDILTGAIAVRLDSADKITVQVRNISNDNDIILYRGQMLITRIETAAMSGYDDDTDTLYWQGSDGTNHILTRNSIFPFRDTLIGTIWSKLQADTGQFSVLILSDSTLKTAKSGDTVATSKWVRAQGYGAGIGGADTTYVIWKTDTQMVLNNGYIHIEDSLIKTPHDKIIIDSLIFHNGDTATELLDLSTANVTINGNWDFQGGSLVGDSIASPYLAKLNVDNGDTTASWQPSAGELFVDTNTNEAYIATPNWNKIALLQSYFQTYEDTTYILTFANPGVYVAYFPEEISPIFKNMSISGDSGILTANPGLHSVLFTASVSGSIDSMGIKGNVFVGNNKSPYLRCEAHVDTAKSSDIIIAGYIIMDAGSILTIKFESENGDRLYIHDAVFAMKREYE